MNLINLFNINPEELDMFQIQATIVFLEVSHFFKNLIKNWYELSCNYHYIDESPSIIPHPNNKKFIVHRNDQSIFSLLIKSAFDWAYIDSLTKAPIDVPERKICLLKTYSLCSLIKNL